MGLFSPYALQAGFEGADLATQLRVKQLQEMAARQKLSDEDKARQARALIGRVLQQAGVVDPNAIPTSPAPGQASVPMQRPGAAPAMPAAPQVPTGDDTGAADAAPIAQNGAPASAPQQPAAPPTPARAPQLSWQQVAEEVRKRTDAPPEVIYAAMQQIMPELENESNRTARADLARAQIDQKNQALMQTLQWRYVNSADNVEREQIKADMKRLTTQMTNQSREKIADTNVAGRQGVADTNVAGRQAVADTNVAGREKVAGLNNGRAIYVAEMNNRTKEDLAKDANDLKNELTTRKLDIDQLKVDDLMAVKQRALDLQAQGMDKKDAQFYAKLDVTKQIANMRDQTTRRGQDMVSADKQAAIAGKIDLARGKAANSLDATRERIDDFIASTQEVLNDPNLDQATGSFAGAIPSVRQGSVNFDKKLDSLAAEKGLAVYQMLKDASATGAAGFRMTNFELQQMQQSISSLSRRQDGAQLRESLLKLVNTMSATKARMLKGYERTYGKAVGSPGGVPASTVQPKSGGETRPLPPELAVQPDGTPIRDKSSGKTFIKRGNQLVETGG